MPDVGFVPPNTSYVRGSCQQVLLPFRDVGGMHAKVVANSASVLSPFMADNAICALKGANDCVLFSSSPRSFHVATARWRR